MSTETDSCDQEGRHNTDVGEERENQLGTENGYIGMTMNMLSSCENVAKMGLKDFYYKPHFF